MVITMAKAKFNILLTVDERQLLEKASELTGESLSSFFRRLALTEARKVLSEAGIKANIE